MGNSTVATVSVQHATHTDAGNWVRISFRGLQRLADVGSVEAAQPTRTAANLKPREKISCDVSNGIIVCLFGRCGTTTKGKESQRCSNDE